MVAFKSLLSFIFFSFLIFTIEASESSQNKPNLSKPDKPFTLTSIEDVEMLTYFLLWKHDYFDNAPDLNSVQGNSVTAVPAGTKTHVSLTNYI